MDGAKFAKMLSDKHLFELDRMEYKYSVSSVQEFTELLRQNFAQPLPLADFSSDELFYLPNLAQISTNGMKQLLSAPASNQTFGLQAMTEEIHATFQIESIHSSRNSIRHILNGYAPRNEEESRIYGMKRGLDFIADRQNTITEENLHQLYQISTGDYLPDEDRLLPDHFYRHDVVYVVGGEESREGLPAQQLPDAMKRLVDFANAKDGISEVFGESATLDRFHGFIPGWEIPRMTTGMIAKGWAINTEYFAEVMHALRDDLTYSAVVDAMIDFPSNADKRHMTAIKRLCTAFLKLLFPHVQTPNDIDRQEFIDYCLNPAIEMRSAIYKQLCIIDAKEYDVPSKRIPEIVCK